MNFVQAGKQLQQIVGGSRLLTRIEAAFLRRPDGVASPPVFLVGPPRSGSTLLYQLLAYHYLCSYFTNFSSVFYRAPALSTYVSSRFFRPYDDAFFHSNHGLVQGLWAPSEAGAVHRTWFAEDAQDAVSLSHIRATCRTIAEVLGHPFVWKNLNNSYHVDRLYEAFPDALFIKMERDIAFLCQSIYLGMVQGRGINIEGIKIERSKEHEDVFDHIVSGVMALDRAISTTFENSNCNWLSVRYEELCSAPAAVLQRIETAYSTTGYTLTRRRALQPSALDRSQAVTLPEQEWARLKRALDKHLQVQGRKA